MIRSTAFRAALRRLRPALPALLLAPVALIATSLEAQVRPGTDPMMGPPSPPTNQGAPERINANRFQVKTTMVPFTATMTPSHGRRGNGDEGGIAGTCPPVTSTYVQPIYFTGPVALHLQAGMVETEIGAVTYVLPAENFPVIIRTVEAVWGRNPSAVAQTTNYSIMFWSGPPTSGAADVVYSSSSEPGDPPPIIIQPGGQVSGVNVQITIDPQDPDQIVIDDDGSHSFTVGWRIDDHANEPTAACSCALGGQLPASCCPPNASQNTFLTTDSDPHPAGAEQNNWLWARPCPGGSAWCFSTGWFNFTVPGTPSNDWIMRTTFEPFDCNLPTGACCINGGSQCVPGQTEGDCLAASGTWQGVGTNCANGCPPPTGACCIAGNCSQLTEAACTQQGGVFGGVGMACGANTCSNSVCCVPSTQQCVLTSQANCAFANGVFHPGTTCGTFVCFPMGACCLEDGTCNAGPMSPESCQALGGTFAGHNSTCASANCPLPLGTCCFGANCAPSTTTQAGCTGLGGTWAYPAQTCAQFVCPYCPEDFIRNGAVDVGDLLGVINAWGPCNNCPADINPAPFGNNQVNVSDLLAVINNWGTCP